MDCVGIIDILVNISGIMYQIVYSCSVVDEI